MLGCMSRLRAALVRAFVLSAPLTFLGASCGPTALGIMPGVINDPHNLSLRRAILAYGRGRACAEVQGRSLAIRPRDDLPTVGRFLPLSCTSRDQPDGDLYLQLGGRGYVWTTMSQRVGFEAWTGMAYDTDFQLDGSTMYVYFRPRATAGSGFTTMVVENAQAAFFGGMARAPNGQKLTDAFGGQMLQSQIARGFTVIRAANGSLEFGLGLIPPGAHPMTGLALADRDKVVLVNDRSELRSGQRDYVPIEVPEGKQINVHVGVQGAAAIDVLVLPRAPGEAWLTAYATQAVTTPPPAAPLLDEPVSAGVVWKRTLAVPAGQHYLVLDNTTTAGRSAPPAGDPPVVVSYAVELD